jgi:hypothetical protein
VELLERVKFVGDDTLVTGRACSDSAGEDAPVVQGLIFFEDHHTRCQIRVAGPYASRWFIEDFPLTRLADHLS